MGYLGTVQKCQNCGGAIYYGYTVSGTQVFNPWTGDRHYCDPANPEPQRGPLHPGFVDCRETLPPYQGKAPIILDPIPTVQTVRSDRTPVRPPAAQPRQAAKSRRRAIPTTFKRVDNDGAGDD